MSKRFEYIDALKGLMILLIMNLHVCSFSMGPIDTVILDIIELTAIPGFFFVSGFLIKQQQNNNLKYIANKIFDKVKRLLIPSLICVCLFVYVPTSYKGDNDILLSDIIQSIMWCGFWFTPTLFMTFMFYYLEQSVVPSKMRTAVYVLIIIIPCFITHFTWRHLGAATNILCIRKTLEYIPFFYAGLLVKSKMVVFDKYSTKEIIKVLVFIIVFVHLYLFKIYHFQNIVELCYVRLLAVLLLFYLFKKSASYWERNGFISKSMQYIGRNTLGLYLLHYFFIPCNMQYLNPYIRDNQFMILLFSVVLSLLLTLFVVCVIELIRKSNYLSFLLLGDKTITFNEL